MSDFSQSQRNPVEALAEEFLDRRRRGEFPSLTEYTERNPELADEIRDVFPALLALEEARAASDVGTPRGTLRLDERTICRQLGDFRLIREVGRGGMGIVYEAEQVSLGRHVALKILPAQLLANETQKRRFERESRAAARLHHTNIVPVFGMGEHHGLHYYAMQFIHGLGLDEVLVEVQRLRSLTRDHARSTEQNAVQEFELPRRESRRLNRAALACGMAHSMLTGRFERTRMVECLEGDEAPSTAGLARGDHLLDTAARQASETLPGFREFAMPGQRPGDCPSGFRVT